LKKPPDPNAHPNLRAGEARAMTTKNAKEDLVDQRTKAVVVMMILLSMTMLLMMLMMLMMMMITSQYLQQ
jgi:hypothetical protein